MKTLQIFALLIFAFASEKIVKAAEDECAMYKEIDPAPECCNSGGGGGGGDIGKTEQKSLLIIFDGTGSMIRDLVQMRDAAKQIVNNLGSRRDNPIKNYVLMVFNDPISAFLPILDTTDKDELLKALDAVGVIGGGDLPELSLTGIQLAVEKALKFSLAYVFTDAPAKDFNLFDAIMPEILRKQIVLNFLITTRSAGSSDPGLKVYYDIASASAGQVFDLERTEITNILLSITKALDPKFVSIASFGSTIAGATSEIVTIDRSFLEFSVSVSGLNSNVSVLDGSSKVLSPLPGGFSSANVKFMSFKMTDSTYEIKASAQSSFDVKVGGISSLSFAFGFSLVAPSKQGETSIEPLQGRPNVLSIFISDQSLVGGLLRVELVSTSIDDSSIIASLPLKVVKNFYSTEPFNVPQGLFRIKVIGCGKGGVLISRLISNGIEAVSEESFGSCAA